MSFELDESYELSDPDGSLSRLRDAMRPAHEACARSAPFEQPLSLARAERELERVLRSEQAQLLARAASIRASRTPLAACLGQRPLGRGALRLWRAQWHELCATARACGLSTPRLLLRCASDDVTLWPGAARLARGALALERGSHQRRVLVACLLAEGRIESARALQGQDGLDAAWRGRDERPRETRGAADDAECGGCP
jgi:hypothetical protein